MSDVKSRKNCQQYVIPKKLKIFFQFAKIILIETQWSTEKKGENKL